MSACGQLCHSWRKFLYIGLPVKPRLHARHSHRQYRSGRHFAFSSLSDLWEKQLFFHFSELLYQVYVIMATMRGWVDVGLGAVVCSLAKISLHRPWCKTTFARLTQSQAISQSFRVFITFLVQGEIRLFFHFSKLFFIQNYQFLYHSDQTVSRWTSCRWRAVNFEIHLWSFGMKADCIWRSISIQYVQIEPGVNSGLRNGSFWVKIRDAKLKPVDRSSHWYMEIDAGEDLYWFERIYWPLTSRDFFLEMLALAGRVWK